MQKTKGVWAQVKRVFVWGQTVRMIQCWTWFSLDPLQVNVSKPLGRSGCTRVIYYSTSGFKLHSTSSIDTCQREQSTNASAASELRELPLKLETRATRDACDPSAIYCTSSVTARIKTVKTTLRAFQSLYACLYIIVLCWRSLEYHKKSLQNA